MPVMKNAADEPYDVISWKVANPIKCPYCGIRWREVHPLANIWPHWINACTEPENGAVQRYMSASKASIWPWVFLVAIVGVVISAALWKF